jgi:hypothetical protein
MVYVYCYAMRARRRKVISKQKKRKKVKPFIEGLVCYAE